ncbi:hypothetical protein P691DRAFT_847218, partial [Macrolepiota fuliginosa MF-IS2]
HKPSVVLDTRAHEEAELWSKSDPAKWFMNPHNLNGPSATLLLPSPLPYFPRDTKYGIGSVGKEILFEELPVLRARALCLTPTLLFDSKVFPPSARVLKQRQADAVKKEMAKLDAFSKVIGLQNADARGVAYGIGGDFRRVFNAHESFRSWSCRGSRCVFYCVRYLSLDYVQGWRRQSSRTPKTHPLESQNPALPQVEGSEPLRDYSSATCSGSQQCQERACH